jgi:hypothetical protein
MSMLLYISHKFQYISTLYPIKDVQRLVYLPKP